MKFLLAPLVAWAIAQAAKVILTSVRQRRLNLRVLAETGGMPSSHAAIVSTTGDFCSNAEADISVMRFPVEHEELH